MSQLQILGLIGPKTFSTLTVYIYYKGVLFQFVYGVQSEFVAELQGRRHCEEIESRTAPLYQQQQVSARLARRPPHTLLRKTVVASPLSENREHCWHLSHFPPQI